MIRLSRTEVLARRLRAHHLAERLPLERWPEAAGACGLQDSPPGSALLALGARVADLTPDTYDDALATGRSLVRTWSLRGAPFCVPRADLPVFTAGVLPTDEAARAQFVRGVVPALDHVRLGLDEATALVREAVRTVLAGERLPIGPLGERAAAQVEKALDAAQLAAWRAEGPYAAGQPYGEAVVHFLLRLLCLEGLVCFAPREGDKAPFALTGEWLPEEADARSPDQARAELARRFVHCHGPTTPAALATWLGVRPRDVAPCWEALASDLVEVEHEGAAWLLREDLDAVSTTGPPRGVRLLPPRDPYTQGGDRTTLLAPEHHRTVWRTVGEPGTVLADGEIVGTWRPRARGAGLTVTVTAFVDLGPYADSLRTEAETLSGLRRSVLRDLVVEPGP